MRLRDMHVLANDGRSSEVNIVRRRGYAAPHGTRPVPRFRVKRDALAAAAGAACGLASVIAGPAQGGTVLATIPTAAKQGRPLPWDSGGQHLPGEYQGTVSQVAGPAERRTRSVARGGTAHLLWEEDAIPRNGRIQCRRGAGMARVHRPRREGGRGV